MRKLSLLLVGLGVACSAPRPRPSETPKPVAAAVAPTAELDRALERHWKTVGVTPAPLADDGEYLRRVSLDLVGRVPTLDEAKAFLADGAPDKRARLVDRLLASADMSAHWSEVYGDLLFGTEDRAEKLQKQFDPESWLEAAFRENRPWDRVVSQILTATGDVRENGAVAFFARAKNGGPEAVAGATARLFLGLQIQCAQCHDHPYDPRWKQEDFYGLVAFFVRTRARNEKIDAAPAMMNVMAEPMQAANAKRTVVLIDVKKGEAKMRRPRSEKDERVQPRFLGRTLDVRPDESRRDAVARAIVTSPLFAKVTVARTWAQLFGRGVVDPWDDLGAEQDPRHTPLLDLLAGQFVSSGHDLKALLRNIALSTAYQRSSAPPPSGDPDAAVRAFARHGVRPLPPQVLVRSLVASTGIEAAARNPQQLARRLGAAFREYRFVFGDDEMAEVDRFDGSVPQALLLWNGELTNLGARAERGSTLARVLEGSREPAARLDDLFLAAYTRRPTADERGTLLAAVGQGGRAAWEDLFFALVTSTEAITNH